MSNPYPLAIYEMQTGRLPGWANEPIRLTIPAGSVTGVLEDFPAMVKLSGASGKTAADVSKVFVALGSDANRKRICITAGDGITPLYVEIKEWYTATQTAYLFVQVPRINPGEDTHLYLYYDPAHAEMTRYVGDTGEAAAQQVWTNGYAGVWHTPSGGQLLDSTANANHGTIYGATEIDGPLGRGLSYDGVDDYVGLPPVSTHFVDSATLSVMLNIESNVPTADKSGCWHLSASPTTSHYPYYDGIVYQGEFRNTREVINDGGFDKTVHHMATITTTPGTGGWKFYQNDRLVYSTTGLDAVYITDAGNRIGSSNDLRYLDGKIYSVFLSSIARSPAWIAATNAALRDELIVYGAAAAPLTLAAYVDAYEYLSWTRRYRRAGAWKALINRYSPAAKEFIPGRFVHFRRNGEDRLGLIETRQISVDVSGRPSEVWTVAGREVIGILADRLCLAGVSTGTGYDSFSGAAETTLRHYVDVNAVNPADASRIVPFLSLAAVDEERGGSTTQSARFNVLADLLESICAASGLGYRGRWSWTDRRLYFEVLEGQDRSSSVKLSPALGNCTISGYNESTAIAPSVAVVAGQGEAAERAIVEVETEPDRIGFARRERFVDARDLADELEQRGREKLAEDGDTTTLQAEYIRTAMYRYGEDFDLGDIVHVEYPEIAAMSARIVEITEEYAREGETITLTLGTEWPDLVSLLRVQRKENTEKRL